MQSFSRFTFAVPNEVHSRAGGRYAGLAAFGWVLWISGLAMMVAGMTHSVHAASADVVLRAYIGTYTGGKSQGIYRTEFNTVSGTLTPPQLAAKADNPSFLVLHPRKPLLYAVGETANFQGRKTGAVLAFRVADSGELTLINTQPSEGMSPCHLSLDRSGRFLFVANYSSGNIAVLPILEDGSLGPATATIQHRGSGINPRRQEGPHAHFILPDPAYQFVLVCDLGLDQVLSYRFDDRKGTLTANDPPFVSLKPGAGPRHLVFHPRGATAYVINELDSTITALRYEKGQLRQPKAVSTLPPSVQMPTSCAEIQVHPSGRFVYGSNRGHDSIAVFAVDNSTGALTPIQYQPSGGKTPRHFAIDPSGKWLLAENQDSDNVVVFRIDEGSGRLATTAQFVEVGKPVCLVFDR